MGTQHSPAVTRRPGSYLTHAYTTSTPAWPTVARGHGVTLWLAGDFVCGFFFHFPAEIGFGWLRDAVLCVRLSCRSVRLGALRRIVCVCVSCVSCCVVMSCEDDVVMCCVAVGGFCGTVSCGCVYSLPAWVARGCIVGLAT